MAVDCPDIVSDLSEMLTAAGLPESAIETEASTLAALNEIYILRKDSPLVTLLKKLQGDIPFIVDHLNDGDSWDREAADLSELHDFIDTLPAGGGQTIEAFPNQHEVECPQPTVTMRKSNFIRSEGEEA